MLCELLEAAGAVAATEPSVSMIERYGSMGILALVVTWGLRRIVEQLSRLTDAVNKNTRTTERVADRVGVSLKDE